MGCGGSKTTPVVSTTTTQVRGHSNETPLSTQQQQQQHDNITITTTTTTSKRTLKPIHHSPSKKSQDFFLTEVTDTNRKEYPTSPLLSRDIRPPRSLIEQEKELANEYASLKPRDPLNFPATDDRDSGYGMSETTGPVTQRSKSTQRSQIVPAKTNNQPITTAARNDGPARIIPAKINDQDSWDDSSDDIDIIGSNQSQPVVFSNGHSNRFQQHDSVNESQLGSTHVYDNIHSDSDDEGGYYGNRQSGHVTRTSQSTMDTYTSPSPTKQPITEDEWNMMDVDERYTMTFNANKFKSANTKHHLDQSQTPRIYNETSYKGYESHKSIELSRQSNAPTVADVHTQPQRDLQPVLVPEYDREDEDMLDSIEREFEEFY